MGAVSAKETSLKFTEGLIFVKKKIISDIRLFKSEPQNEFGGYIADSFDDKKLGIFVIEICI